MGLLGVVFGARSIEMNKTKPLLSCNLVAVYVTYTVGARVCVRARVCVCVCVCVLGKEIE